MSGAEAASDSAPTYRVPQKRIVSIEHPSIIHSFQNAFKSLGGEQQLKHVIENEVGDSKDLSLRDGVEQVVGVSLRPDDPFGKKLSSTVNQTGNVLIKVTVPMRTGRKRKRGSSLPFGEPSEDQHVPASSITAEDLLQRMRDNQDRYTIKPVGLLTDTHQFKDLPDFQVTSDEMPVMQQLRDQVLSGDYNKMRDFKIKGTSSVDVNNIPPPPNFIPTPKPPPNVLHHADSQAPPRGRKGYKHANSERGTHRREPTPPQLRDLVIEPDAEQFPASPDASLPPPPANTVVTSIIEEFSAILDARPIMNRRVYTSKLQGHKEPNIRRALPYLAYYLDAGPWRFNIVKFGIDPRTDPKYRIYQTVSFSRYSLKPIIEGPAFGNPPRDRRTFDGKRMVDPSEMWQLCDFTHPLLHNLVHNSSVRPTYDATFGWYFPGTLAKIVVITRDMMIQLANPGRAVQMREQDYELLANLPDQVMDPKDCLLDPAVYGEHVCRLAEAIGDEAKLPTVLGARGYEEVWPVRKRTRRKVVKDLSQEIVVEDELEEDETGEWEDGEESEEDDAPEPDDDQGFIDRENVDSQMNEGMSAARTASQHQQWSDIADVI
jgi:general transcription factor 3C polypeptide 5 (transcription factor C subunit 1)